MSRAGQVEGVVKILDSGPNSERWDLMLPVAGVSAR